MRSANLCFLVWKNRVEPSNYVYVAIIIWETLKKATEISYYSFLSKHFFKDGFPKNLGPSPLFDLMLEIAMVIVSDSDDGINVLYLTLSHPFFGLNGIR